MLEFVLILVVAVALFVGPAWIVRQLARIPFYWLFCPANTFAIIVTEEDGSGNGMIGGGNIVNVLHAVPGEILRKNKPDPMEWEFEPLKPGEEDPDHGFLFKTLGVQSMGSIFFKTRMNHDKRMRFVQEEGKEPHTTTSLIRTRNVFYTGELTVVIKEADTADNLGLDFEIDFIFKRQFPLRSVLRLADSAAFLTSLVERVVNNTTVSKPAGAYIGGEEVQKNRRSLAKKIEKDKGFSKKILDEIGLNITAVSLRSVSMPLAQRELLQMKITAEKEAEAKVIAAGGDRDAQMARNIGDADRVERVIKPAAQDERTVAVRVAEAYENNKTVTTFAPGADNTMIPLGK